MPSDLRWAFAALAVAYLWLAVAAILAARRPLDPTDLTAWASGQGLDGLPEGQRQVLVLRDVYGQSTEEVANAMGLTPGAVKVRLFRARERLNELTSSAEGPPPPQDDQA